MNEPEWYQHDGRYILVTESRAPLAPAIVTAITIAILLTIGLLLLLSFGPESFRSRDLSTPVSIGASERPQVVEPHAVLAQRRKHPG